MHSEDYFDPEIVLGSGERYSDEKHLGTDEHGNLPLSVLGGKVKPRTRFLRAISTTCQSCKQAVSFDFDEPVKEGAAYSQICYHCNQPIRPARRLVQGWIYRPMLADATGDGLGYF